jgi:catechol 2,3-dioxygenase-like lactoylglutathione lyase family enzyme
MDEEIWPGARLVEVAPPGSPIALVLLPEGSDIPMAIRMETPDAEAAYAALRDEGVHLHNDEVVRLPGIPAMFFFADPDGNGLVYLEPEETVSED